MLFVIVLKKFQKRKKYLLNFAKKIKMVVHTFINQAQLASLRQLPNCIIYKHSSNCTVSSSIYTSAMLNLQLPFTVFMLTVQTQRELSNYITNELNIPHATPQAIIMHYGVVKATLNHSAINEQNLRLHL